MVQVITPRRLFARRRRTRAKRFILGLAVGLFSAASATVALPWADRILPDALVFGLSAALWMAALLACCPRIRPGHCIHCGYDLRQSPAPGQPGAGRCPECGTAISPLSTGNIPIPSVP